MLRKLLMILSVISLILFETVDIRSDDIKEEVLLKVEVKGEVENPGVFYMEKGSCIADVLEQAGLKENADLSGVPLQQELFHTQILVIPEIRETRLISINSAPIEELILLPGIGTALAERIIAYREEHGGFRTMEELMKVSGIGQVKYERIKEFISL